MSTSSCSTVKRCASSLARSSTSPTSRSSRSASAATTSSDSASQSGVDDQPSRSASTWPRIAVSGVRSSCETDIRKFRSCSSASASRAAICRKRSARWLISSPPALGHVDVVPALGDLVGRLREREHGIGDPARQVPGEPGGHEQADPERDQQQLDEREPAVGQVGLLASRRRARRSVCALEDERLPHGEEGLVLARRRELEGGHLLAVDQRLPLVARPDERDSSRRPEPCRKKTGAPT